MACDQVADIVFDLKDEKVNKLTTPVMEEFDGLIGTLIDTAAYEKLLDDSH